MNGTEHAVRSTLYNLTKTDSMSIDVRAAFVRWLRGEIVGDVVGTWGRGGGDDAALSRLDAKGRGGRGWTREWRRGDVVLEVGW